MNKKSIDRIISGRTRFARDIVAEFWVPARTKAHSGGPRKAPTKAIILCDGCPSVPSKHRVGEFFARKGYWVFHPRYRGSWESDGEFLKYPPREDILLVAASLDRGFTDMWSKTGYVLDIDEISVVGASFGGAAALLASLDQRVDRVIALAPPVDFRSDAKGGSPEEFMRQITEGFGGAYRMHKKNLRKLTTKKFYNPVLHAKEFDPKKIFIAHALDDKVVPVLPLRRFAKQVGVKPLLMRTGGHFSTNAVMLPRIWKEVKNFLKKQGHRVE